MRGYVIINGATSKEMSQTSTSCVTKNQWFSLIRKYFRCCMQITLFSRHKYSRAFVFICIHFVLAFWCITDNGHWDAIMMEGILYSILSSKLSTRFHRGKYVVIKWVNVCNTRLTLLAVSQACSVWFPLLQKQSRAGKDRLYSAQWVKNFFFRYPKNAWS